jgi:putative membrane protein
MSVAYAHGLYDPLPENLFSVKWDWDPTLLFFLAMTYFYLRGLKHLKKRNVIKPWQVGLYFTGLAVLSLALLPPIDPLSDRLFFFHMIQHLMITSLGVPLIMFGVPFFVIIRGAPLWFRQRVYFPLLRNRVVQFFFWLFSQPLPALILFQTTYWVWHIPFMYNLALFNDVFHLIEHASFALAAMFLWRNISAPAPMKSKLPYPARLLFLAIIMASNIALAALLTFSKTVWYGYEGIPQPKWWTWGYLQDQQLGGLIMWVPGGIINFIAMTICFFAWVRFEQKKDELRQQQAEV